jgi:FkbM family methyltransferase
MSLFSTLRYIAKHPLNRDNEIAALFRFLKWQLSKRLNPYPIIYNFTQSSKLIVEWGMTGATGNLYCGLHEFNDMGFALHFLRSEDRFIDIGANIGSYTVLAAAHVGAFTTAIEPVPNAYRHLVNNVLINNVMHKVNTLNLALGSSKGFLNFTSSLDTVNHVATKDEKDTIQVNVAVLDELLKKDNIPTLLKIDVEGYETEVIKGATETLSKSELKAIIIELNGSGKRYGYDESKIHETLSKAGFKACSYNPFDRRLSETETFDGHNTIYVRDMYFVKNRLLNADKVKILNKEF